MDLRSVVANILVRNWDPLENAAHDVHEKYISDVHAMIVGDASEREIAEFLVATEANALGYRDTEPETLIPVVKKLKKLVRGSTIGG